ncbi:DUF1577 domain-containing protein [Leptospira interrogans]|uniref:PF07614 family protein n=2 Tax=Leptospira interrogans TaxID=173 RepID=M7A5T2_LEPIR|nr:DUF1577 domain-containing protein [Leptospira interrogans]EMP06124.1 PF07614 family protein [Leptospira interrogans serovar Pyrogenes str. 200701872]KAA1266979.1 DUF1577 domain-containing protein [Leptospira interrogans serovar Weerasinghe]AKP26167.1 hypothetical protein LIMLP_09575 [Leptospira interrogans serovar Manilae]AKP29952.1 hypothetical protein LIMHP_09580 [Leptospira interrogans serovar Manilae]EJP05719.1 PF07614 family protein [Leptospira interrogans serovar Bulgarica str. Mallik
METIQRKKREKETISDPTKKFHIISKFLVQTDIIAQTSNSLKQIVKILQVSKDATKILVQTQTPNALPLNSHVTLAKLLAKYVELSCEVIDEKPNNQFILSVSEISIASKERSLNRIVPPEGTVWITNIRTSKTTIDANLFNIPTSVKVNFADYETKLKSKYDFLKVDVFGTIGDKFDLVKKTRKILYISNTQKEQSYAAYNQEDFIDYAAELGDEEDVHKRIIEYANQKIKSELIVPVIYLSHEEQAIPIGFVHAQNRNREIDILEVMEIKTLTFEMVDRIRESNTILVKERFPIVNISTGGLKVKINHPDLNQDFIKRAGFTFDIFFKMQAPLTAFGVIRSVTKDTEGNLYVGLSIEGNSYRPGERKKYIDNVNRLLVEANPIQSQF